MLYRGTAGDCCAAFFKLESFPAPILAQIRKISCAAVFAQFVILVFAVVSTARKSRPADRWPETILQKLRRRDLEVAEPWRILPNRAHQVSPAKNRVFRQLWPWQSILPQPRKPRESMKYAVAVLEKNREW
jgi:hypothetical protein